MNGEKEEHILAILALSSKLHTNSADQESSLPAQSADGSFSTVGSIEAGTQDFHQFTGRASSLTTEVYAWWS